MGWSSVARKLSIPCFFNPQTYAEHLSAQCPGPDTLSLDLCSSLVG